MFTQTEIAIIWDFDKTLSPMYMQDPLFKHFKVDKEQFWKEVNSIPKFYEQNGLNRATKDTAYLNHMLTYVNEGLFPGLDNNLLKKLGEELEFYPGLPQLLSTINKMIEENVEFKHYSVKVEHYIVSTGLRQMILGSDIAGYVDDIWACEFVETVPLPGYLKTPYPLRDRVITQIGYTIDNTSKTRAVFEINKGTNKHPEITVNSFIKEEERRIPFKNMVCVGDGPSDIPMFSLIKTNEGRTLAVYKKGSKKGFNQVNDLQRQGRIESCGEADYREGSNTFLWITSAVEEIARRIVKERSEWLETHVGQPPNHITKD